MEIQDSISPTIIERLNIDNNYDGKTFHIVYSDVPERKDDLVRAEYQIEIPGGKGKAAVKIIDMLGEEVINIFEV